MRSFERDVKDKERANTTAHERYLAAVVSVQQKLLVSHDPQKVYTDVLTILGDVSGASRVCIFENYQDADERFLTSRKVEWCASGVESKIDNPLMQGVDFETYAPVWLETLSRGEVVKDLVKDLPEQLRNLLEGEDVRSVLILPLIVKEKFFGLIGFDDCIEERVWEESEVELLQAAAQALSLAHERMQAEKSLRESEESFREIFDNANDLIYLLGLDGKFISINKTCERLTGYTTEDLPKVGINEIVTPEYLDISKRMVEAKLSGEKEETIYELEIVAKNGRRITVETNTRIVYRDGKPVMILGIARDITERKKAEREIQAHQERFSKAFNASPISTVISRISDGVIVDVNEAGLRSCGFTREEVVGRRTEDLHLWDDVHAREEAVEIFRKQGFLHGYESSFVRKDGERRNVLLSAERLTINDEECILWSSIDITERKRAEEELHASQELFFKAFNSSSVSIVVIRFTDGMIMDANETALQLYGYKREEVVGKTTAEIHLWSDSNDRAEIIKNIAEKGYIRGYEANSYDKHGNKHTILISAELITLNGEKCVLCTSNDITKRKEAEHSLRLSEERYRSLVRAGEQAVWSANIEGDITKIHSSLLDSSKWEQLKGWGWLNFVHPEDRESARHVWETSVRTGRNHENQYRYVRADGSYGYIVEHAVPIRGNDGAIKEWIGSSVDITERVNAENALRASEERYRAFVENSTEAIWCCEHENPCPVSLTTDEQIEWMYRHGVLSECNDAMAKMYGYKYAEEIVGTKLSDLLPPSNPANIEYLKNFIASGYKLSEAESQEIDKDGNTKYFLNNLVGIIEDGKLVRAWGTQRDITERRMMENALRETNETLQTLIQSAPVGIIVIGIDGKIKIWNPLAEKILGWNKDDSLGTEFGNMIPAEYMEQFQQLRQRILRGETIENVETVRRRKDGTLVDVTVSGAGLRDAEGNIDAVLSVFYDNTEHKRAEAALRESEMRFRVISETASDYVFDVRVTRKGNLILELMSDAFLRVSGYSMEDLRSMTWGDLVHPDDLPSVTQFIKRLLKNQKEICEYRFLTRDGEERWIQNYSQPIWSDKENRVVRLYGAAQDITERKQAEKALQESELRFRKISEAITDYAYEIRVEEDGRLVVENVSDAFQRVIGYTIEELEERGGWLTVVHPDDVEYAQSTLKRLLEGKRGKGELRFVTRGGATQHTINYPNPVWDEEKGRVTRIYGSCQDITERKLAEEALHESQERLRQAQKMEAIGRLAGGIAHDFNNILTSIIGYSDISLHRLPPDESVLRRNLQEIRKSADRAAKLTHQLLAYSRKQILQPSLLNLNDIIFELDKMLRRVIGEDVKLEVNLASGLGKIKADKGQIEQVLMNLVVNARDAMLKGGNLFIQTSNIELTEPRDFKDFSILAGKYVLLQVKDAGHGMSEEIQERIFEPFFTTKEVGKGTGLGLATVYGIIKQSEGYIIVESELEKGTTFNIYLPTSEEKIKSADGETSDLTLMRGVETILLVEDDEPVRQMTQEILETSGYKVLVPADCNEAIDFCRKYEGTIHLLLTDVVMPELNGRELAERLLLIRPKMKVLYMSGYSDDEIGAHGVLEENLKLIQKPYTIKTITRGVREMLDSYEEN